MRETMLTYFAGEKHAALTLVVVSLAAFGTAAVAQAPRWELRSLAVTVAIFGVISLAIGVGLYMRTDPQVADLLATLAADPGRFYDAEAARMARVQRNFVVIQRIELAAVMGSAVVSFLGKSRPLPLGIAMSISVFAAFYLAFDLVAERRGAVYLAALLARH